MRDFFFDRHEASKIETKRSMSRILEELNRAKDFINYAEEGEEAFSEVDDSLKKCKIKLDALSARFFLQCENWRSLKKSRLPIHYLDMNPFPSMKRIHV